MNLLFIHDHRFVRSIDNIYYSKGGLSAGVWERYLRHFDRVTVVARDGGLTARGAHLPVMSHPCVEFRLVEGLNSLDALVRPNRKVLETVRSAIDEADAVVARLPSELGLLGARLAHRLRKPYAVEVVGCAWDGYLNHGAIGARLYAPLAFLRMRAAIARAPLVLYVTSRWLQQRYPGSGAGYSVSDVEIMPMDEEELASRRDRLASLGAGRPPVLGTIASLRTKSKGVQTAISAIAMLKGQGLELHYSILGAGDLDEWRALSRSHGVSHLVHFDGTRDAGKAVRDWLDGIDIHLQPSFQEGLPRATIEAMSRGVACIGSTCGGIPELLPTERMHQPGDVAGLAERIRSLATAPDAVAAASHADLTRVARFYPDVLQARRDEFYKRLREGAEQRALDLQSSAPVS